MAERAGAGAGLRVHKYPDCGDHLLCAFLKSVAATPAAAARADSGLPPDASRLVRIMRDWLVGHGVEKCSCGVALDSSEP